jgi:uridine kinase
MQMDMAFIQTIANNIEHMLQMFLKILCGILVVYDEKLKQKHNWKIYVQIKNFIQFEPWKKCCHFDLEMGSCNTWRNG